MLDPHLVGSLTGARKLGFTKLSSSFLTACCSAISNLRGECTIGAMSLLFFTYPAVYQYLKTSMKFIRTLSKSRFCGAVASTLYLASLSKILIKFIPSQEVTGDLTTKTCNK